ncbi:PaaX family transcriptional regulator C-terminal domain-containing protein [Actinomadura sp. NBRC 104425]|uniref:PaaX family transcriptional regulator C-terminal domain-containing protein n=1 Tax=Actinomadura sp. NBRC 104425 TaxID=3032204 RepID=UPI00331A6285
MNAWRRFPGLDPQLPPELLPPHWIVRRVRKWRPGLGRRRCTWSPGRSGRLRPPASSRCARSEHGEADHVHRRPITPGSGLPFGKG